MNPARAHISSSNYPLAPSYPHNSPYAFSENRVVDGVELEGLEWETTKYYNEESQEEFALYVADSESINHNIRRFCEDLVIGLLIDFAKTNGYPIVFKHENGLIYNSANSTQSLQDFKFNAMKEMHADELMNSGVTKRVGNTQCEEERCGIETGDILFSLNNDDPQADHVQIVVDRGVVTQDLLDSWEEAGLTNLTAIFNVGDDYAIIKQGNLDPEKEHKYTGPFISGEEDPASSNYEGAFIQTGYYNLDTDTYTSDQSPTARQNASASYNQEIHQINTLLQNLRGTK